MDYNYRKLVGKITEVCKTQANFAKAIGVSDSTMSLKLNNHLVFKQDEISKACKVLDIEPSELFSYFFTEEVRRN